MLLRRGIKGVKSRARPTAVVVKKPQRVLTDREKQQVRRMIDSEVELKFINAYLGSAAVTSTPIITGMTDIAQGDTDSSREGDRVKLVGGINLRGSVFADVATGDVTQTHAIVRLIIFQWHPTSASGGATEPTAANVLLDGPSGSPDVYSHYSHDQRQNFSVVYDEVFEPIGVTAGGAGAVNMHSGVQKYFTRRILLAKKIRHQMQFQAASTVNATNHLYFMSMSNLAADAQNPTLIWSTQVFYRDG